MYQHLVLQYLVAEGIVYTIDTLNTVSVFTCAGGRAKSNRLWAEAQG